MATDLQKGTALKSLTLGTKVLTNAQYDELYDLIAAKVASVGATADKGIEVGGTATAPTVGIKLDPTAGNLATLGANGLMVTAPAQQNWYIKKLTSGDTGYSSDKAAQYQLCSGTGTNAVIDIPKDMVVSSGTVETKSESGAWGEAGTYLVLTLANATSDKVYINVGNLIEYVTSGSGTNDAIQIAVSSDHKVTATVKTGSITNDMLAGSIAESKLDSTTQTKIDNGAAAKTAVDGILDGTDLDSFADVESALDDKQDALTFDATPTASSDNPVKSGGVYTALEDKCDKVDDLADSMTLAQVLTGMGNSFAS